MLKYLKQSGMSLIEVMLGGAMLAAVGLVGAELYKRQMSATKYAVARAELDTFHDKISKMIQDSRNCNANFASSFGGTTVAGTELGTALYQCCPGGAEPCEYDNYPYDRRKCLPDSPPAYFNWATDRRAFVRVGDLVTPKNPAGFILNSMTITDAAGAAITAPSGNAFVKAEIRVAYKKVNTNAATGVPDVLKRIPVTFKFSANALLRFQGCVDAEIGTKNTLQQELCKSLGPNLATYDPEIDKCVYKETAATHTCPAGEVLRGIDSNGSAICLKSEWAFDEGQIIDSSNANGCAGGANVRFVWHSGTNTIKVECGP